MLSGKKNINAKNIIYILCFILLNISDMMRDLQFESFQIGQRYIRLNDILPGYKMGDVWLILGNFTGIVMMLIVLSGYKLKKLCTRINAVWTVLCMVAMIVLPFVRTGKNGTILAQEELAIINLWWLIIVIKELGRKIIKEKILKLKTNYVLWIWAGMTVCMFLSITQNHIWPIFYFAMFGVFFVTQYQNRDIGQIYNALIDGSIIAFYIMQIVALFLRPYDTVRYQMLYSNCNSAAEYYLIIYIMCLCKLHILELKKEKKVAKVFYLLTAGAVLALQLMTCCRIVWAASVIVTAIYGLIVVKKIWKKSWKQTLGKGMLIVTSMLVTFLPVFMMVRYVPTILPARLWYSGEYEQTDKKVAVYDSADSEKYVELDELIETALGRIVFVFFDPESKNENDTEVLESSKNDTSNDTIEQNGIIKDASYNTRLEISEMYLRELTWWGNKADPAKSEAMYTHAHNLYIQIAYFYGIPSGILLIVLMVALFVRISKKIKNNIVNPYMILALLITIGFFFTGLTNVVWNIGQLFLFLIFFVQYPYKDDVNYLEEIEG